MPASAPARLRCEYLVNPLGLDVPQPRLSWEVQDSRRGARQTAYQILAADSPEKVSAGRGELWDSGRVAGEQSCHVPYAGPALRSRQRVHWAVRTWDVEGQPSPWSSPAWWETGLLEKGDWKGQWIGAALCGGPRTASPCPFVRTAFRVDAPVASARLYVTALGLYEFHLNGQVVGDGVFTPGWTDYRYRVQYETYDVAGLLRRGDNAAGAILGDGWYCGQVGWKARQNLGDRPKLLAQLVIQFTDGRTQVLATDGTWRTAFGPLLESDFMMGESYDARREMPGWDAPGFADAAWQPVALFAGPNLALVARASPPVRRVQELKPVSAKPVGPGAWEPWVFDLGQNMVGRVRLKVQGKAGTTVKLRFAEMLKPDGHIYTENLRSAKCTDYYTLRGASGPRGWAEVFPVAAEKEEPGGEEVYEPRFTFHGFRYVEVSGFPGKPTADALTGIVLHSDCPPTGEFECSEPLLNQLQHNIQWGQKGNFLEVPTDCPQRDERLGWMGDAQVFCRTAAFNMDVAPFFTKWQTDIADAEASAPGCFPHVAPNAQLLGPDGGPAWSDAGLICPWIIYLCYGDTRLLAAHYPSFVRFVEKLRTESRGLIRCYDGYAWMGYGDWLSIKAETPKDLIGTAFFAHSARLLARIARVLGHGEDAAKYEQFFEEIRGAFQRRFVTPDGAVAGLTQTGYVLALHFDLLPRALRPVAAAELARDVQRRGDHLSCGFVGSSYLPYALAETGHLDVAYKLLHQKTFPSWLYAVTQGATTIWERWDGWTGDKGFQDPGMNSFNHYAYGAIGQWLYATVAGLDLDPAQPGYKRLLIRPRPGGGLTRARARLLTLYGAAESSWRIEGGSFSLDLLVPANTTAAVHVPAAKLEAVREGGQPAAQAPGLRPVGLEDGAAVFEAGAGKYAFTAPCEK